MECVCDILQRVAVVYITHNCFKVSNDITEMFDRKDVSKEGDETIVNHFHGVSSSSEDHRDVCGQTDPGSWILLDRTHVK